MPKKLTKTQIAKKFSRFPVTDLAIAIARTEKKRESFLRKFIAGNPPYSFQAVRSASHAIYGVELPLSPHPKETPEQIEAIIRSKARPHELQINLDAARHLSKLLKTRKFRAFPSPYGPQSIHVGPGRIIPIGLNYYLIEDDRVIFQFLQARGEPVFDDRTALCLGSLIQMAYCFGDFEKAEVDIADLSAIEKKKPREPRFRKFGKSELLSAAELNLEIKSVYALMKKLYDGA